MIASVSLSEIVGGGYLGDLSNEGKEKKSIYFLSLCGEVVYVGQTLDITKRLNQHGDKDFDSVSFFIIDSDSASNAEAFYIVEFNPVLNKVLPKSDYYKTAKSIKGEICKSIDSKLESLKINCSYSSKNGSVWFESKVADCIVSKISNFINDFEIS